MKLYRVEITALPIGSRCYYAEVDGKFGDAYEALTGWTPDGWLEDEVERREWILRYGDTRFFWPSTRKLYQSKSGAEARAALIRSYGATVEVIESDEIVWLTPEMKRDRKIAELRAEIARLESPRLAAVAS